MPVMLVGPLSPTYIEQTGTVQSIIQRDQEAAEINGQSSRQLQDQHLQQILSMFKSMLSCENTQGLNPSITSEKA